jgi:hypothetical protein
MSDPLENIPPRLGKTIVWLLVFYVDMYKGSTCPVTVLKRTMLHTFKGEGILELDLNLTIQLMVKNGKLKPSVVDGTEMLELVDYNAISEARKKFISQIDNVV